MCAVFDCQKWEIYSCQPHDMHGNVQEWVADCGNGSYSGAPTDGSAWLQGECSVRVKRGGCWSVGPRSLRAAYRNRDTTSFRLIGSGIRVARMLNAHS